MNPDFQRRIQRYGWDEASTYYDRSWQEQLRPAQERLLAMADIVSGDRVLDVACGTGLVTLPAAAKAGETGHVHAVDLSDKMVEALRRHVEEAGLKHVAVHQMDAEALDFPDRSFDVALCSLGLMYVPDPARAVEEMSRCLVDRGRAVAAVWGRRDRCGWADLFPIIDRRVSSDVCPLFFQLGTGDNLAETFEQAGLRVDTNERMSVTLRFDTADAACDAAFWGGAVALAWQKFDEATRESARAEYLDSISQYRNGSSYDVPGEFVVVAGRKHTADA